MVSHIIAWHRTDSVINRMVLYTISTGLITSVVSCFLLAMVHFSNILSFQNMIMPVLNQLCGQFAKYGFHIGEMSLGMVGCSIFRSHARSRMSIFVYETNSLILVLAT